MVETSTRRLLVEEVLVVLALSFLASAVFAILDLVSAPIAGIVRPTYPQYELPKQLASIIFALAPVWLVVHLARRSGEGTSEFGLDARRARFDLVAGSVAAVVIAAIGLVVYLVAVRLEVNRFVVPVPPVGHWWTVPVLVLGSAQNALTEEIVVVGYLVRRLEQIGLGTAAAVGFSAALRATYHLYQGFGGFLGNLALGVAFAWVFARWRRTWPLALAHFLVDCFAGLGYIAFRGDCFLGACIR